LPFPSRPHQLLRLLLLPLLHRRRWHPSHYPRPPPPPSPPAYRSPPPLPVPCEWPRTSPPRTRSQTRPPRLWLRPTRAPRARPPWRAAQGPMRGRWCASLLGAVGGVGCVFGEALRDGDGARTRRRASAKVNHARTYPQRQRPHVFCGEHRQRRLLGCGRSRAAVRRCCPWLDATQACRRHGLRPRSARVVLRGFRRRRCSRSRGTLRCGSDRLHP
jgi:hypothetical protein